ncbi:MAG: hypothetical protein M1812_005351 [Candelaria pacifica]|nr:MAG: hypothetical protein M1812_005351 [Candelaria pacifica]
MPTIGALIRPGLMSGAPAGLTVSGTVSPLPSAASTESIAETRRGARNFTRKLLTLLKGSAEGGIVDESLASSSHLALTLSLNRIHVDSEVDLPEDFDLSGEDDTLSTEELEMLGERQDIEIYTKSGDKLSMPALIDTCSDPNLIRRELVVESGHAIEPYDGPKVEGSSGSFMPEGKVVIRLHFNSSTKALRTWRVTLLIAPDEAPFDVVLGKPFILRSRILQLDKKCLVLQFARETAEKKAEREKKAREEEERNRQIAAQEAEERRRNRALSQSNNTSSGKKKDGNRK